jgi:two-component system sensor histidine kinase BaeS
MKLKFKHKVFLSFLLNSLVIVICMFVIAGYYASRNFEDYINKVEMERLAEVADALSREYRMSGSWAPLLDDVDRWLEMAGGGPGHPPGLGGRGEPPFPLPPLPPVPRGAKNHEKGERGTPGEGISPPSGPPPDRRHMPPRISLFDAEKQPLIPSDGSPPDEGYRLKPILVDDRVVGWLGIPKHERPTHPLDLEFLRVQSQTFQAVGGVALLLAVFVTFVLSRHLLAPVKELAEGARALTSRRFETRIEVRARDEFGQLAADFNAMAQALERYEQMRRQWMADISHELRTPLAILRAEIEAIQDGVREATPEALESLHFEVMHVGRIVQDLHDLSLIESRAFDAEQTAVNPLAILEDTLRSFHTRFEQRGIRIEAGEGGTETEHVAVMADSGRLTQLFSNLLENTLRYADAPGVLRIIHEIAPGRLLLHIEDSGPGVPEESLGRLFDRLYRVDKARSRAQGGSGLGLAICKSIVESFGGRIEASNAPTGGLRISIAFPLLRG